MVNGGRWMVSCVEEYFSPVTAKFILEHDSNLKYAWRSIFNDYLDQTFAKGKSTKGYYGQNRRVYIS